jgi:serine palmitoyltransferase
MSSILLDYSKWDYMFFTRIWAQVTKHLTKMMVPSSMHTNPAFETFIWFVERTENLTLEEVKELIIHFPENYRVWWNNLYRESPIHVLIETGLVLFIFWLIFIRRTVDPKKASKQNLEKLTPQEVDWLVKTWQPEPLVPDLTEQQIEQNAGMVCVTGTSRDGYITVEGIKGQVLNLSSFDYLGLSAFDSVQRKIQDALNKYGCGSCGPRGFYGTIDVHLQFEHDIAKFMGTEEAIAYSDSASGATSTITAFAKKGDLLLMDEACHEAIRTGVNLSRATVRTYKHNDMKDLQEILEGIAAEDKKKGRDVLQQRRFIVTEGLFRNTGEICKLPALLNLKEKFFYRLIMDDSQAFGTLGKTGRGTAEYFGIPITDLEIVMFAMDATLASVGGVCIGTNEIVDHQRLSGPGYCFSASACPFLSAAASQSLKELEAHPELVAQVTANAKALYTGARAIKGLEIKGNADEASPILHLQVSSDLSFSKTERKSIIMHIAKKALELGTAASSCKFSLTDLSSLAPSIRICATAHLTPAQIKKSLADVAAATAEALKAAEKGRK